jgi:hypothetical protein
MTASTAHSRYPLLFDMPRPSPPSRWTFVRWPLLVPHLLLLGALEVAFAVTTLAAGASILVAERYPRPLFRLADGIRRWRTNVWAYGAFISDGYPPFSLAAGRYPVEVEVEYPEHLRRFGPLYKPVLAVPHVLVVAALDVAAFFAVVAAGISVLLTGRYPRALSRVRDGSVR